MVACTKAVDRSYSGTTKLHRLEENIASTDIQLNEVDLKAINEALSNTQVEGARYSEGAQKMIDH